LIGCALVISIAWIIEKGWPQQELESAG